MESFRDKNMNSKDEFSFSSSGGFGRANNSGGSFGSSAGPKREFRRNDAFPSKKNNMEVKKSFYTNYEKQMASVGGFRTRDESFNSKKWTTSQTSPYHWNGRDPFTPSGTTKEDIDGFMRVGIRIRECNRCKKKVTEETSRDFARKSYFECLNCRNSSAAPPPSPTKSVEMQMPTPEPYDVSGCPGLCVIS